MINYSKYLLAFLLVAAFPVNGMGDGMHRWSQEEKEVLRSLWIESLPPLPADPSNRWADDMRAARLGKKFFSDTRFSGNAKVSCATCHREDYTFTDDLPRAHGMGTTGRRTMPLAGAGYFPWLFWDGRKDSLWSQALGPVESAVEHGISRTFAVNVITRYYREEYEPVFGDLPGLDIVDGLQARPGPDDPAAFKRWLRLSLEEREQINRVYTNFGKAIAAYVRTIVPGPSRFDHYVAAVLENDREKAAGLFNEEEAGGLSLFIGQAGCTGCHNGPLFTNNGFHNLGVPPEPDRPFDPGRSEGILQVMADEFNCLGPYSDAAGRACAELWYLDTDVRQYTGAMKTPTLRNVADRPPYMHAGQLGSLEEVLVFYREAADNPELEHQGLSDAQIKQVIAFLKTLSGPIRSLH